MVQESITEIISEVERMVYSTRVRDFYLSSMLKNTAKPAPIFHFLDCGSEVLIHEEITEY